MIKLIFLLLISLPSLALSSDSRIQDDIDRKLIEDLALKFTLAKLSQPRISVSQSGLQYMTNVDDHNMTELIVLESFGAAKAFIRQKRALSEGKFEDIIKEKNLNIKIK